MGSPAFAFVFSNSSQFVPVTTGGQLCTPDMVKFDADDAVAFTGTTSPNSPISLAPPGHPKSPQTLTLVQAATATITVNKGKTPTFNFAVCDGSGNYEAYFLAGVALQPTTKSGTGGAQFPQVDVRMADGITTLDLTDRNGDDNAYEFVVLVQNAAGQIGLIDPRIVNQV